MINNKKIKNYTCCGNCIYRNSMDNGDHQIEGCNFSNFGSWEICKKYEFDNLSFEMRIKTN